MKKTVFALTLFRDRNQTLLRELTRRFRVLMFERDRPPGNPEVETVEALVSRQEVAYSEEHVQAELQRCLAFTRAFVAKCVPERPPRFLNEEALKTLYRKARGATYEGALFRALLRTTRVDLLVGAADYSVYNRPVVLEARRQGIPTLDVQHSFIAAVWEADVCAERFPPFCPFISDFVNLDNDVEREVWQTHADAAPNGRHVTFLTNGTPNDVSCLAALSREEARTQLGLRLDSNVVTVAGSWSEARRPTMTVLGPLGELAYFEGAFRGLAALQGTIALEVVVKLHPAYASDAIFDGARAYLENLAERTGLARPSILCTHTPEVLAASDLLVAPGCSSLLWEGLMTGVPGLVCLQPHELHVYRRERLNRSNVLFREGLLRYVFDDEELAAAVRDGLAPENRRRHAAIWERLRRERDLRVKTAEEKSRRLCDWIEAYLNTNGNHED